MVKTFLLIYKDEIAGNVDENEHAITSDGKMTDAQAWHAACTTRYRRTYEFHQYGLQGTH
jgi:hypothetical protein